MLKSIELYMKGTGLPALYFPTNSKQEDKVDEEKSSRKGGGNADYVGLGGAHTRSVRGTHGELLGRWGAGRAPNGGDRGTG